MHVHTQTHARNPVNMCSTCVHACGRSRGHTHPRRAYGQWAHTFEDNLQGRNMGFEMEKLCFFEKKKLCFKENSIGNFLCHLPAV